MSAIEVVTLAEPEGLADLARSTYGNIEPGFQIEGVGSVEQLYLVFEALKAAAPKCIAGTIGFMYTDAILNPNGHAVTLEPHTDDTQRALAVLQNISEAVPVKLATAKKQSYSSSSYQIDLQQTLGNCRKGLAMPGDIIVISQGGYDWLLPTIHFFDRRKSVGPGLNVRYSQSNSSANNNPAYTAKVAKRAFARLEQYSPSLLV